MTWKDVNTKQNFNDNRWNWREDNGEIIGEYIGSVSIKGKFGRNFNVHSVRAEHDKQIWEFTGSTVVDNKLSQVEQGLKVRIAYLGKVEGDKGQTYHDWTVQVWEDK